MEKELDSNFIALKVFTKAEVKFEIGKREFTMKPLTPNKLGVLVQMIESSVKEIGDNSKFEDVLNLAIGKILDLFPLLFNEKIDQEFVDEHMSIPLCIEIGEQLVKLNRLEGILPFFQQAVKVTTKIKETGTEKIG